MLKIGVIGLGGIAQKAYLPVFSSLKEIEWHLYTRNEKTLEEISQKYRFPHKHQNLLSLIQSGIKAAFVHSSTESHFTIVKELLLAGIHVYVDKPITYNIKQTVELINLAKERNLTLMTGFNRRFAPAYDDLLQMDEVNMILMQKNRNSQPLDIRTFIYDDFIHVLDTVRYLIKDDIQKISINGIKKNGLLYSVVVQLFTNQKLGLAIMNRDSGVSEEKLEIMCPTEKRTVVNLSEWTIGQNKAETKYSFNDWDPTLYKRGFESIIKDFIESVKTGSIPSITTNDALRTHEICEEIIQYFER